MLATLPFGRTGHDSSRVVFGAAALAEVTQDEADRTLALLLDRGVNHIDVARSYGEAEVRLRPFLDRHRDEFFLATKTGDRTAEGAYAEIYVQANSDTGDAQSTGAVTVYALRVNHSNTAAGHTDDAGTSSGTGPSSSSPAA